MLVIDILLLLWLGGEGKNSSNSFWFGCVRKQRRRRPMLDVSVCFTQLITFYKRNLHYILKIFSEQVWLYAWSFLIRSDVFNSKWLLSYFTTIGSGLNINRVLLIKGGFVLKSSKELHLGSDVAEVSMLLIRINVVLLNEGTFSLEIISSSRLWIFHLVRKFRFLFMSRVAAPLKQIQVCLTINSCCSKKALFFT